MMLHCPYCGTVIKDDELFCIKCGEELPSDLNDRFKVKKPFNRYWYLPMLIMLSCLLTLVTYHFILQGKETNAKELYQKGETSVLNENYKDAQGFFKNALKYKSNFYEAEIALNLMNKAVEIESNLAEASIQLDNLQYQEALSLVNQSEISLKNYHGTAVTQLINHIVSNRNDIKVEQLKTQLNEGPDIDQLKILLWESETIKNDEAEEITLDIRNQIIDYTFSKASEQLNNKQFNNALLLVEDGLKYASNSEKLISLKTTVDKEKTAFETAEQQRIEQAIHLAEEEQEKNKLDAVKLNFVNAKDDNQDKLVVKGEVSSIATVPVDSILIEYTLLNDKGNELLTNKVFVFPDKLYPNEVGKFEFTHYDLSKQKNIKVKVNKITWYTD